MGQGWTSHVLDLHGSFRLDEGDLDQLDFEVRVCVCRSVGVYSRGQLHDAYATHVHDQSAP